MRASQRGTIQQQMAFDSQCTLLQFAFSRVGDAAKGRLAEVSWLSSAMNGIISVVSWREVMF